MSRPKATVEPGMCGEPWPQAASVLCVRDKDHKGGHLNGDLYWQAEEPASVTR